MKWPHAEFCHSSQQQQEENVNRNISCTVFTNQNKKLGVPYGSGSTLTTGTSLLSKNLFSGTGGISSGRTTGLSRFVLRSTLSATSLLSERLLRERARWETTISWKKSLFQLNSKTRCIKLKVGLTIKMCWTTHFRLKEGRATVTGEKVQFLLSSK